MSPANGPSEQPRHPHADWRSGYLDFAFPYIFHAVSANSSLGF